LVRFFSSRTRVSVITLRPLPPGLHRDQPSSPSAPCGELTGFIGDFERDWVSSTRSVLPWVLGCLPMPAAWAFPSSRFVQRNHDKFDYLMEHQELFHLHLLHHPGLPKDYFCYLLGLSPMHILTFLMVSTIGKFRYLLLCMQGRRFGRRITLSSSSWAGLLASITLIYRDRISTG
jgi:hypothetical protein